MTYAVTILAAFLILALFLLACALVGGSEQRGRLQAKVEHRDARIEDLENELRHRSMDNHPAGRGLRGWPPGYLAVGHDASALREALEERDAGHDGGEGA